MIIKNWSAGDWDHLVLQEKDDRTKEKRIHLLYQNVPPYNYGIFGDTCTRQDSNGPEIGSNSFAPSLYVSAPDVLALLREAMASRYFDPLVDYLTIHFPDHETTKEFSRLLAEHKLTGKNF